MSEIQSLTLELFNKGLIINPPLDLVPDEALIKAKGISLSQEGVIELSNGTVLDGNTLAGSKVHSIAKIDLEVNSNAPTGVGAALAAGGTLTVGTTYYYVVTAVIKGQETIKSAEVSATPTAGNQTINVSWTAVSGAQSYKVYRTTAIGVYSSPSLAGSPSASPFSDTGVSLSSGIPPDGTGIHTYVGADNSLWRNYVRIDTPVSPAIQNKKWTSARLRHTASPSSWIFLVNGTDMLKDNGNSLQKFGISAPSTAPSVAVADAAGPTKKDIDMCESTAGWTGTGTDFIDAPTWTKKEGLASIRFGIAYATWTAYIQKAFVADLTDIGGSPSPVTDHIHFWMRPDPTSLFHSAVVRFDINDGTWADQFYYTIYAADLTLKASDDYWQEFNIMKSQFNRLGSTPAKGWNTVQKIRLDAVTPHYLYSSRVHFDDIYLKTAATAPVTLFGNYTYKVTFVNTDTGHESNPGPESAVAVVNLSGKKVVLSSIPTYSLWDNQVNARRMYRKGGNVTNFMFVAELSNNTTTTYDDTILDSSLGVILETDNDPPLASSVIGSFQDYLLLAIGNRLYYSKRHKPESWPPSNYLPAGEGGEEIVAIKTWGGNVYLFKERGDYRLRGTEESNFVVDKLEGIPGTLTPFAVAESHLGIFYVNHDGAYLFNGASARKISLQTDPIFHSITKNGISPISGSIADMVAAFHDSKFYFSYPDAGGGNTQIIVYDPLFDRWYHKSWGGMASFCSYETLVQLLGGGLNNGKVYKLDNLGTYTIDGAVIPFDINSKYYNMKLPLNSKLATQFEMDWESSNAGENLAGVLGLDNGASTISLGNFATAVRTISIKSLEPAILASAKNFSIRLSGNFTQKVTIHKLRLFFIPLPPDLLVLELDWNDLGYYGIKFLRHYRFDIENVSVASQNITVSTYADGNRTTAIDTGLLATTDKRDNLRFNLPPELSGNVFKLIFSASNKFRVYKMEALFIRSGSKEYERVVLQ